MRAVGAALLFFLMANGAEAAQAPAPPVLQTTNPRGEAERVLEQLHRRAAAAEPTYFDLFTPDAVYIGTDASERWTLDQFRAFAEPYFRRGQGWTYTLRPGTRHIQFSPDRQTAWFDEILDNASYGTTRGTGVLVRTPRGWRIAQYHLTIPMPNGLAREFVGRIRESERAGAPAR